MNISLFQLLIPIGLFIFTGVQLWHRYPHNHGGGFTAEFLFGMLLWSAVALIGIAKRRFSKSAFLLMILFAIFLRCCDVFNLYIPYERWIVRGMPEWGRRASVSMTVEGKSGSEFAPHEIPICALVSSSGGSGSFVNGRYTGYVALVRLANNSSNSVFLARSPNSQDIWIRLDQKRENQADWSPISIQPIDTSSVVEIPAQSTFEFDIASDEPLLSNRHRVVLFGQTNNSSGNEQDIVIVLYPDEPEKTELLLP